MRGKLTLAKSEDDLYTYNLFRGIDPIDYEIIINTDLTTDFISLISQVGDLDESIDCSIEISDNPDDIALYKKVKENKLAFLRDVEYVAFEDDIENVAEYVKKNPVLKTKKILFTDFSDLDLQIVERIESAFDHETANIYFNITGNFDYVSFDEYRATIIALNNMVNDIKKFAFSPLEEIMYVYDLVRSRIYEEVDKGEDKAQSRSLSSVLLGNKIVCVGYARIFKTLLEKLGIEVREVLLYTPDKTNGHARNEIYVKDPKYGVDGVYYFDPTWNSKKNENDESYLLSYRYFAMTKSEIDSIDNGQIIDERFPYFSTNIATEIEKIVTKHDFTGIPQDMLKSINHMAILVTGEPLIRKIGLLPSAPASLKPDKDEVVARLQQIVKYFDKPLSADVLLQVSYNVIKNKYYGDFQNYAWDLNTFFQLVWRSNWVFNDLLFDDQYLSQSPVNQKARIKALQFKRYAQKNELEKNMAQVKLTKTLKNIYESKKD